MEIQCMMCDETHNLIAVRGDDQENIVGYLCLDHFEEDQSTMWGRVIIPVRYLDPSCFINPINKETP